MVEGRRHGALVKRFVLIAALVACKQNDGPRATGSLMFEPREAADVFIATEIEVMRSEPILRRLREQQRVELAASAITAKRRAGTMVLDVTVHDRDPQRAAQLCNDLLRTYFDYRMSLGIEAIAVEQQVVAEALDRDPNNVALKTKLDDLELKRRTRKSDVRLLDPCVSKK